ncbi:hypothetical protein JTL89_08615, partial [Pseudomonas aeruginosa]|nr:hypothetical protein [Pseudomonas aeruginosa]
RHHLPHHPLPMLYRITRHTALTSAHRPRLIESTHTTTILTRREYPMAHNGIVELLCIYGFIFGGLAVLLLLLLFVYSVFLLVFRRRKTACTELGFLCSAFIIWFVNYVFSGGGLFHPVGAALFWLVVFRFLYILRRKRDVEHISKEVVYG